MRTIFIDINSEDFSRILNIYSNKYSCELTISKKCIYKKFRYLPFIKYKIKEIKNYTYIFVENGYINDISLLVIENKIYNKKVIHHNYSYSVNLVINDNFIDIDSLRLKYPDINI